MVGKEKKKKIQEIFKRMIDYQDYDLQQGQVENLCLPHILLSTKLPAKQKHFARRMHF